MGQVFHKKLSHVNLAAMVSETVCTEMLSPTAYGKRNGNLSATSFAIWVINRFNSAQLETEHRPISPCLMPLQLNQSNGQGHATNIGAHELKLSLRTAAS
ncbi:hypothetical protein AVEN_88350-1 [Araneus ventricosus]|uniref:Uncharacterized protein n=1 Tax=Araneus ventricosus TaxID=182803 RepID=A0A4Y2MSW0_ARAVE|nr:hypothetical protein AVEN_235205-1 [Araneus ventricosus]GBN30251.1 hypothetical protein AVEN_88350-1 [Araneus ventricosus]